jgi:mannosyltransferase
MTADSQTERTANRIHLLILAGITTLAALLRFFELGRESLWFDETFSVYVAVWNPRDIILRLTEVGLRSTDRNLFNLLLHYVLQIGRSEALLRAIPALSGVLCVVALYALGKRLLGQQVAIVAAFLLAISPLSLWFSRDARGYMPMTMFGLLAAYFMVRALADNRPVSWAGYVILAACGAYTHSFGVLVIGAVNLFALIYFAARRRLDHVVGAWVAAQIALGIILVPLVRGFVGQGTEGWGAWISERYGRPGLKALGSAMGLFSFGTAYGSKRVLIVGALLVFAIPCLVAIVRLTQIVRRQAGWNRESQGIVFTLCYLAAPVLLLFAASQFRPLFLDRYLLAFVPPYLLLVSYGIHALPKPAWQRLFLLAIVMLTIPGAIIVYEPGQKEDWRDAAAYVAGVAEDSDAIVFYDSYISTPFDFYYQGKGEQVLISRFAYDDEMAGYLDAVVSRPRTVWLVYSHADDTRPADMLDKHAGVTRLAAHPFRGLTVYTYRVGPPQ